MSTLAEKRERLLNLLGAYGSCAVAYSGGVDSAVVAMAAHRCLGRQAIAVTGVSPSVSAFERRRAHEVAEQIGIRHVELQTDEFANAAYRRNAPDRCFHCKDELYRQLRAYADTVGISILANGANADDVDDYRPGMRAAGQHNIQSPLAECGCTKQDVRDLAAEWGLAVWNKPATPCLSSRVAYGQQVTPARLAMIESVEEFLRERGLQDVRVRYHEGDLARLEVPLPQISKLAAEPFRVALVEQVRAAGFRFVTLDLEGFRSGSLNQLVQLDTACAAVRGDEAT